MNMLICGIKALSAVLKHEVVYFSFRRRIFIRLPFNRGVRIHVSVWLGFKSQNNAMSSSPQQVISIPLYNPTQLKLSKPPINYNQLASHVRGIFLWRQHRLIISCTYIVVYNNITYTRLCLTQNQRISHFHYRLLKL